MIIAGPCLLNDNVGEIENCFKTAKQLHEIDPEIMFRFKIYGGGTHPSRYIKGIGGEKGTELLLKLRESGYKVGTEIRDYSQLLEINEYCKKYHEQTGTKGKFDFIWMAARSASNYQLIDNLNKFHQTVVYKRRMDMTIEEAWSMIEMIKSTRENKDVYLCDRGIIDFTRTDSNRWSPDFKGMLRTIQERKDIELMFDPTHCLGKKDWIFPMVKAACAIGVKHFMLEVYADPTQTQTDQAQALSVEEFKPIYEYIKLHEEN